MQITKKIYFAVDNACDRLVRLRRWSSEFTDDQYDELAKQGLNYICTYFLASYAEHAGYSVKWENFPKILLYRMFQKAYVLSDNSEQSFEDICELGEIEKLTIKNKTRKKIAEKTTEEFAKELSDAWESKEARIFRAASTIATYVELLGSRHKFDTEFNDIHFDLVHKLVHYEDIPGFIEIAKPSSDIFKLIMAISKLRYQNRWVYYATSLDCSVLGHNGDTGAYVYLMCYEMTGDEHKATIMSFKGGFHDVPEKWTNDIPSPIKDEIEGFRKGSERYEMLMIARYIYSVLPPFMKEKIKEVMMEEEANAEDKPILKGADYLSASCECYRQIFGSFDYNFYRACSSLQKDIDSGKVVVSVEAVKFFHLILKKIEPIRPLMINREEFDEED